MSTWMQFIFIWLADYYALATAILLLALLAGALVHQPIKRYSVTAGAFVGLIVLAILSAAPFWPRLVFIGKSNPAMGERPIDQFATVNASPIEWKMPIGATGPMVSSAKSLTKAGPSAVRPTSPPIDPDIQFAPPQGIDFAKSVIAAFITGAGIVSIWLTIGALRIRRLCHRAEKPPEFAIDELNKLSLSLRETAGVRGCRIPQLLVSRLIDVAAACGLLRPTILLPSHAVHESGGERQESGVRSQESVGSTLAHSVQRLSLASSLRPLIAHEWAHIRRGDLWLLAASRLLLIVLFAHPLYWLLRRRQLFDQELLADAEAAAICGHQEYAETLLGWARHLPARRFSPAGALGIWNRPGQLSRRIAMLLDERIRLQSACSRFWKLGTGLFVISLVGALSLITLRPAPIARAQAPIDVPAEQRVKLPITGDRPADRIAARVGSEIILVGDIKAFLWQTIEEKNGATEIKPDEFEQAYEQAARPILKRLVEMKLICNDAVQTIPAEGLKHAQADINQAFDTEELPQIMKACKASTRQELEEHLHKTGRSLDWERRSFFEKNLYAGWIQQQLKANEITVPLGDVLGYYTEHYADFELKAKARWEELMVSFDRFPDKGAAWAAITKMGTAVQQGKPFAEIAKAQSQGITASNGGVYEWTTEGSSAAKKIDEIIFGLPIGALSKIIETDRGFHIVRVLERKPAGRKPFEEAQAEITKKLDEDKRKDQIKKYLDGLRQKTPVWSIFDGQPDQIDGPAAKNSPSTTPDPGRFYAQAGDKADAAGALIEENATVVSGVCVDEHEKPIPNARVRLFRIDHANTPFYFPMARWKYTLSPSFGEQTAGPELQYESQYYAPASQRVLQETRSNEKGEFQFRSLTIDEGWRDRGDAVLVVAQAPGKASNWSPLSLNKQAGNKPQWSSPITLKMPKGGVIRGRVTNQAGKPIAGAVVWKPGLLMLYKPVEGLACAITDADGRYEIADMTSADIDEMPPFVTPIATIKYMSLLLSVQHPDYADGIMEYSSVPATCDITLQPAATLRGQVLFDDGQEPARKASVEISFDNGTTRYVPVDETGNYSVSQLAPGNWHVRAWTLDRPSTTRSIDLHAGQNELDLRLPKGGTIKGRIIDVATGKTPVVDPRIGGISLGASIAGHDARESSQGYMNNEGTFSMVVQPGKNLIGLSTPFWKLVDEEQWKTKGVEVVAGQTVEIELRLAAQVPAPPPMPKEPLSAKGVLAYLSAIGTGINTETIDGRECVTDIYTQAFNRDGEAPELPRIGWLEKNVLLNIKEFPKLRALGLTNPDGGDAALEPLRGVESLETLCIGGAPDVANQTLTSDLTMAAFDHFATLPNLKMLYVLSPHFDDRAFGYVDRWPKLEGIELGGSFTLDGVKQLRGKSRLKQLGIFPMGESKLGDECLDSIGTLTNLENLGLVDLDEANLHRWLVTDNGLKKLAGLKNLKSLTLQCPQITNAGLIHLREMKKLTHLDLKGTAVTQEGIDELKKSLPKLNATGYRGWKPALPKAATNERDEKSAETSIEQNAAAPPMPPYATAKAGGAIQAK
jgi:hypothetical protein